MAPRAHPRRRLIFSLAAALAAGALLRARYFRPRRGHCPRCNYDLQGLRAPTCPECGHSA
ncbi:MAG: hypothetical protein WD749_07790 [Phycisphaerales bacterium]